MPFRGADGGRRRLERRYPTRPYVQPGSSRFTAGTRQLVVDWMLTRSSELRLEDETLHLAVRYLDTFLAIRGADAFLLRYPAPRSHIAADSAAAAAAAGSGGRRGGSGGTTGEPSGLPLPGNAAAELVSEGPLTRRASLSGERGTSGASGGSGDSPFPCKLRRLGLTALFIAAKLTEPSLHHTARDFAKASGAGTDFGRAQIVHAERALLRALSFDLVLPTAVCFASAYAHALAINLRRRMTVRYLCDLSLLSHAALSMQPSQLAAAAVGLVAVVESDAASGSGGAAASASAGADGTGRAATPLRARNGAGCTNGK